MKTILKQIENDINEYLDVEGYEGVDDIDLSYEYGLDSVTITLRIHWWKKWDLDYDEYDEEEIDDFIDHLYNMANTYCIQLENTTITDEQFFSGLLGDEWRYIMDIDD